MTPLEIHARLLSRFPLAVGPLAEPAQDFFLTLKAEALLDAAHFLKEDPDLALELEDLTALDWPARNVIEVVLHLFSFEHRHGIVVKIETDRKDPRIPSLSGIFRAAEFFEREVLDLFGVTFTGHPDPRRIMLPDDWEGHPLRKDYREAGGWHGISNERENPLVELRRLDDKRRAEALAAAPAPGTPPAPEPKA